MSLFGPASAEIDAVLTRSMDEQVTIQTASTSENEIGEEVESWSDLATVDAIVDVEGGNEVIRNDRLEAERAVVVKIEHRSDVGPGDRLRWNGRTLEIHAVNDLDNTATILEITCTDTG